MGSDVVEFLRISRISRSSSANSFRVVVDDHRTAASTSGDAAGHGQLTSNGRAQIILESLLIFFPAFFAFKKKKTTKNMNGKTIEVKQRKTGRLKRREESFNIEQAEAADFDR